MTYDFCTGEQLLFYFLFLVKKAEYETEKNTNNVIAY